MRDKELSYEKSLEYLQAEKVIIDKKGEERNIIDCRNYLLERAENLLEDLGVFL